ncbi:MAG: hypothetical protein B9S32_05260 [Verrucomicrobia bacterium Tous-C9LFEB]|nr:MAG: hypothetical protein B9S32_05260 [Verrucomicrobia bacterium Tous-C9LFEB]
MATRSDSAPTLRDVGRLAGVTATSASLALRNDPRISPATKARIVAAAKKLGYVPDPLLSALVARRGRQHAPHTLANMAALLDDGWLHHDGGWLEPLYQGMERACQQLGYHLDILNIQRDLLSLPKPDQLLYSRGVRGLVILPLYNAHLSLKLNWERYSFVSIGNPLENLVSHRTGTHLFASMTLACEKLRKLGYRRVGLVHPLRFERRISYEWHGSLCKETLTHPDFIVVPPHLPEEYDTAAFVEWVRQHQPECILTNSPIALREMLEQNGWKVPRDIGIVALSRNFDTMQHFSGVAQHLDLTAEGAVRHVHQLILKGETGMPKVPSDIRIAPDWYEGDTIRRLRRARAK